MKSGAHDTAGERHEQDGCTLLLAEAPLPVHPLTLLEHHPLAEPHRTEDHGHLVHLDATTLLESRPRGLLPMLLLVVVVLDCSLPSACWSPGTSPPVSSSGTRSCTRCVKTEVPNKKNNYLTYNITADFIHL